MRFAWTALAALVLTGPVAQAQVVIQTPGIPGVTTPTRPYPDDYWRHSQEGDWRRREEYREQEARREEWRHSHCVRDWRNEEYCRR